MGLLFCLFLGRTRLRLCICVCKKARERERERERELLLSLIATRWIVEAGEVDGDGGGGWRRGVVCIVL